MADGASLSVAAKTVGFATGTSHSSGFSPSDLEVALKLGDALKTQVSFMTGAGETVQGRLVGQAGESSLLVQVEGADAPLEIESSQVLRIELPRTMVFSGVHGTNRVENVVSLEAGLDYAKQCEGGGDPTQYSGPGFYFIPKGDTMEAGVAEYGHHFQVQIYTQGLDSATHQVLKPGVMKSETTLIQDSGELTEYNHPLNMWVSRNSDIGPEMVVRPHLYDKGQLMQALEIAAAFPVDDARGALDSLRHHCEDALEIGLERQASGGYKVDTDPPEDGTLLVMMGDMAFHASMKDGMGPPLDPGVLAKLTEKYGDLEVPTPIFEMLYAVARFDFHAVDARKGAPEETTLAFGPTTGERILPSREELAGIIAVARTENPAWYAL